MNNAVDVTSMSNERLIKVRNYGAAALVLFAMLLPIIYAATGHNGGETVGVQIGGNTLILLVDPARQQGARGTTRETLGAHPRTNSSAAPDPAR
jgi:hypothetical protein